MRTLLAAALALAAAPAFTAPALAQGHMLPPGDYASRCTNIRMEGQFLSAVCRGAHGSGPSSINVQSCSTGIFVDDSGALACIGPGGGRPPEVRNAPPGYATTTPTPAPVPSPPVYRDRARPYDDRADAHPYDRGDGDHSYGRHGYGAGYGRSAVELFRGPDFRGPSMRLEGPVANLGEVGLNDHVRSIRLPRGSGPWLVCTDAGFRGRCTTIWHSVEDTGQLGMRDAVSSLRPAG